ncbi:APC family permease [Methanooceanicella nereidis]|nr:APC family permease [Methanocella sp. CWC-04]
MRSRSTADREGSLGVLDLVGLGVGGTIGSGIFVVPAVAAQMAGPSSLLSWVLCSISFGAVLACLTLLSTKYAISGAFYTLFFKAFDRRLARLIILDYVISGIFGMATIAAAIGENVSVSFINENIFLIGIIILFGLINLLGIVISAWVEDVLTALKILPLILVSILLLPFIDTGNFTPFAPAGNLAFLGSAVIVYWCYTGFEVSAIPSGSVKDPKKNVPLSLMLVFIIVTLIYFIVNFVLIGSAGAESVASTYYPLSYVMERFYAGSGIFVLAIALIAMLSALNAYLLGTATVLKSFAAGIGSYLSKESNNGVPYYAIITCTALGAGLIFFSNYFVLLASISVIMTLIPYIFLCWAAFRTFKGPGIRIIAIIGILSSIAVLVFSFLVPSLP